ncbi:peptidoglycan-binding protein [Mesorhizobium mediterraneum]|uniref:peptidoglycan-binding protein n=1 Tax=Mesorhizobium mediterraneum TaxID=43617 RepID=UPI00178700C8
MAKVQALLNGLGYDVGPIDGQLGSKTKRAIKTFQQSSGLAPTGQPSGDLIAALRVATAPAGQPLAGAAPAFDCRAVSQAAEGAICASPELAALDRQLGDAYAAAANSNPAAATLLQSAHHEWIEQRNSCGADTACIATAYRGRIADVAGQTGSFASNGAGAAYQTGSGPAFTLLHGYDLPYGDFRSGTTDPQLRNISSADCQWYCAADGRCRSFTYNAAASVCILKETVPQGAPFAGAVSGIKGVGTAELTAGRENQSAAAPEISQTIPSGDDEAPPTARMPGGRLVAPAIAGAPIASPPSVIPAQTETDDASPPASVGVAPGPAGTAAPTPAVGLIAPAPEGGHVTQSAGKVPAPSAEAATIQAPMADDVDPLTPGGVSMGMKGSDAVEVLEVNGYRADESWLAEGNRFIAENGKASRSLEFFTGPYQTGPLREPISLIDYEQKDPDPKISGTDVVSRLSEKIGTQPNCPVLKEKVAECHWPAPPDAPLVLEIVLTFKRTIKGSEISLRLQAVRDLEARMASPSAGSGKPANDFDPLAPGGAAIGMALSAAEAALAGEGYSRMDPNECYFATDTGLTRKLRIHTGKYGMATGCDPKEPAKAVRMIQYTQHGVRFEGSLIALVERMNERLGGGSDCSKLEEQIVKCYWATPPGAPLIYSVNLSASKTYMDLELRAVNDLESRVKLPPPPAPPPLEEQAWWLQEIARSDAEAKGAGGKFIRSERFEQLPRAEQARLRGEGSYVYDYCKSSGSFAQLHDCRCVASKLVELRIDEGSQPLAQNEREAQQKLIGKADNLADACPNKAGAASYAHESCTSNHAWGRPAEAEFCACYADIFAEAYMNNPMSNMQNVKNNGVFAIQECERRGHASR